MNATLMKTMILKRRIFRALGISRRMYIIQIELAGKCSAMCEFCEWWERPQSEKIFMDTNLAKKCLREARELNPDMISLHVTGESLNHPDLLNIIPDDYPMISSTNCLSLNGEIAERFAHMDNLTIVMAILWSEPEEKRKQSIANALEFLNKNPKCYSITVQMICSVTSIKYAQEMYDTFSPYLKKLSNLRLVYHQPLSVRLDGPTQGFIPSGIPESRRVIIERYRTPRTCGEGCINNPCNPTTSIYIQSDGQIRPCCVRWEGWDVGNAKDMPLKEAWEGKRMKELQDIWRYGDKNGELKGLNCLYMTRV
jgi:MoaA/NifB/PqqE/SkfB family radical SAM enzyme